MIPLSTPLFALVVDDDALIRMDACAILADVGFQSYEAVSGDQAKLLIAENASSLTLLFTDVQMPGETDGFALARHVGERWPHIEIVVASGNRRPGKGDIPDHATFIDKPFTERVVLDHLKRTLPDSKQPEMLKDFD